MFKKIAIAVTFALLSTHAFAAAEVGKPAPDFSVVDVEGKTHTLAGFKGKTVVLEWNNPECPFVHKFYDGGDMQKLQADAAKDGVVWVTVNSGAEGKQGHLTPEATKALLKEKKFAGSAYVLDSKGELGKKFGAKTTPHMFVIDEKGTLVYAGAIDDKPSFDAADIKGAKNYVVAALADLKAGKPVAVSSSKAYGCSVKY